MDITLVIPPTAPHTHTVVFLHGRGDNAEKFAASLTYSRDSGARTLRELFPSFKWVFPQAPVRACAARPADRIRQWFDIWNVADFGDREALQAAGLRESVAALRTVLADEAAALGGRFDHVVLAGISQGAATGVHALLNLDVPHSERDGVGRLAAFLGFSCRLPFPGRSLAETRRVLGLEGVPHGDEVVRNTPVLLEHCVDDPLVLVANGRVLRDTLCRFGAQVGWCEYPDGGHWFNSPAGMDDAARFLREHVPGIPPATVGPPSSRVGVDADAMDLS
ncbi:Phospholipase/Carboxylesterase family protein [Whalleya microplaca]|nr:Phospholipase/Carboxylesterase family protein [Whalleya microplaca]